MDASPSRPSIAHAPARRHPAPASPQFRLFSPTSRRGMGQGSSGVAAAQEGRHDLGHFKEALNKSTLARRRRCGMGCAKGDEANGRSPFARSLTRQTARKAPSRKGCSKIGRSWRCAPWHRSPGYDLRRAPYDYPAFSSNALGEDLFSASLRGAWD
jgi:hypothetical protein